MHSRTMNGSQDRIAGSSCCANCSVPFSRTDIVIRKIPVGFNNQQEENYEEDDDSEQDETSIPLHIKQLQSSLRKRAKQKTIKVYNVLSSIYKFEYMSQLTFPNIPGGHHGRHSENGYFNNEEQEEEQQQQDVSICENCADVLTQLFEIFQEFSQLRKQNSYLARKIGRLDFMMEQIQDMLSGLDNHGGGQHNLSLLVQRKSSQSKCTHHTRSQNNTRKNNNNKKNSSSSKRRQKSFPINLVAAAGATAPYDNYGVDVIENNCDTLHANDDDELYNSSGLECSDLNPEEEEDYTLFHFSPDSNDNSVDPLKLDDDEDEVLIDERVLQLTKIINNPTSTDVCIVNQKVDLSSSSCTKLSPSEEKGLETMEVDAVKSNKDKESKTGSSTVGQESNQQLTDHNLLPPVLLSPLVNDTIDLMDECRHNNTKHNDKTAHNKDRDKKEEKGSQKSTTTTKISDENNDNGRKPVLPNHKQKTCANNNNLNVVKKYPHRQSPPSPVKLGTSTTTTTGTSGTLTTTRKVTQQNRDNVIVSIGSSPTVATPVQNETDSQLVIRKTLVPPTTYNNSNSSSSTSKSLVSNSVNGSTLSMAIIGPWGRKQIPTVAGKLEEVAATMLNIGGPIREVEKDDGNGVIKNYDNSHDELNHGLRGDIHYNNNINSSKPRGNLLNAGSKGTKLDDPDKELRDNNLSLGITNDYSQVSQGEEANSYDCTICRKELMTVGDLHMHLLSHVSPKSRKCPLCDFAPSKWSSLASHLAVHINYIPPCPTCGQSMCQRQDLDMHTLLHSDDPHSCLFCHNSFGIDADANNSTITTSRHLLLQKGLIVSTKRKKKERSYICSRPSCRRAYNTKNSLIQHLLNHSAKYPCQFCKKTLLSHFGWTQHLKNHMTTTTSDGIQLDRDAELEDMEVEPLSDGSDDSPFPDDQNSSKEFSDCNSVSSAMTDPDQDIQEEEAEKEKDENMTGVVDDDEEELAEKWKEDEGDQKEEGELTSTDDSHMEVPDTIEEFAREIKRGTVCIDSEFYARMLRNGHRFTSNNEFFEELISHPEVSTHRKILRKFARSGKQQTTSLH